MEIIRAPRVSLLARQTFLGHPDLDWESDEPKATLRRKRARQVARTVLPNSAETKIVVTGNIRAWRHFIELRGATFADAEIRRLAICVLKILQKEAPQIFADFQTVSLDDGTESAETPNSKV